MESKYLTRLLTLKAGSNQFALSLRWSNQGEQSEPDGKIAIVGYYEFTMKSKNFKL